MWLRNKLFHLAFDGEGQLAPEKVDFFRAQLPTALALAGEHQQGDDATPSSSSRPQKRQSSGGGTTAKRKRSNFGSVVPAGMTAPAD